ncbi:MAG TPA: ATP-binding protein [Niabella sp.]|nr:ATP-binding protein [Niabella sp.]
MLLYIKIIALFLVTGQNKSYHKNSKEPARQTLSSTAPTGIKNNLEEKKHSNSVDTSLLPVWPTIGNAASNSNRLTDLNASFLAKKGSDILINAINLPGHSRSIVTMDMEHLSYIHAKAEAALLLLKQAEEIQKKTERKLSAVGVSLGITLLGSLFIIIMLSLRQRAKFMNFKLNLARNIHDETNPALLYAKALARSHNKGDSAEKTVLEQHIDHIMFLIRSLSHDLKSDKPHILSDLVSHTEQLLLKLNTDNTFQSNIIKQLRYKQFISYYQFSQLKAVLNECITNTIKHAIFNTIEVDFRQKNNQLTIRYRDDGKGWDATVKSNGIGIDNIKERIHKLNGSLELNNQYPNGYCFCLTIPLR